MLCDNCAFSIPQLIKDCHTGIPGTFITHMSLYVEVCTCFGDILGIEIHSTSGDFVLIIRIGDVDVIMGHKPAVTVDTAEIGIVKGLLRFADRIVRVVRVVRHHGDDIVLSPLKGIADVCNHGKITPEVLGDLSAVNPHLALAHYGLEMEEKFFAFQFLSRSEVLAIPDYSLVVDASARLNGKIFDAVRK